MGFISVKRATAGIQVVASADGTVESTFAKLLVHAKIGADRVIRISSWSEPWQHTFTTYRPLQ